MSIEFEKEVTPSPPSAGKLTVFHSDDLSPEGMAVEDASGNVTRLSGVASYRAIGYRIFLADNLTYTPTTGTKALLVLLWGGGGAGGSCLTAVTNAAGAGGGGSGAYAEKFLTASIFGACKVRIGAAGAAAAAGNNAGGNGGDSEFEDTTNTVVARADGATGGSPDTVAIGHIGGLGGPGGTVAGSIGDLIIPGRTGGWGVTVAAAQGVSGAGAPGVDGTGGGASRKSQGAGSAASANSAAGGSGGCILSGGASVAGGNGGSGLVIIWELG